MIDESPVVFPRKLQFLFRPYRYKVAYGGRGGTKSWGFARALIIRAKDEPLTILCGREFQNSIQDSVHKLLKEQIEAMGYGPWFEITNNSIRSSVGSQFIFAGIRNNPTKIKSTEGIDIAWIEEAEKVSNESWEIVIPTVRKPGSEIWVSFNPNLSTDPTYQRFVINPPPGCKAVKVGWQDNPWFPDVLRREMEYLASVDPDACAHVWGGECREHSDAQILKGKYSVEWFEPGEGWDGPYFGADWGFAQDPTTLVKCWTAGRVLYIEAEAYGVGVDIDRTPAMFGQIEGSERHVIRADSARPETISYLQRHGYPMMRGVDKWKGSVEDGIAHLRQYERIIIHPNCIHTAEEARLYSYKVDRLTGDVLPDVMDMHNHCMDAIRYALAPLIKRGSTGMFDFMREMAESKKPG